LNIEREERGDFDDKGSCNISALICRKMAFHARHRWLISRVCEAYNASAQEVESFLKQGDNMKILANVMKETTDSGDDLPRALFILRQPPETCHEVSLSLSHLYIYVVYALTFSFRRVNGSSLQMLFLLFNLFLLIKRPHGD
jgi:hypothetical protein